MVKFDTLRVLSGSCKVCVWFGFWSGFCLDGFLGECMVKFDTFGGGSKCYQSAIGLGFWIWLNFWGGCMVKFDTFGWTESHGEVLDDALGIGFGDGDEAVAVGDFEYHAVFFATKEFDVVDIDEVTSVAAHEEVGGEGLFDVFEGVVEDELLFFFSAEIVDVGVVVGGFDVEDVGALGGEGEFAALVAKVDGDVACFGGGVFAQA